MPYTDGNIFQSKCVSFHLRPSDLRHRTSKAADGRSQGLWPSARWVKEPQHTPTCIHQTADSWRDSQVAVCVWENEIRWNVLDKLRHLTSRQCLTQRHSISDVLAREGRVTQRRAVNGSLNNWICDETERAYKDRQSFSCSMGLWWCIDLFMQLVFLVSSLNSNMTEQLTRYDRGPHPYHSHILMKAYGWKSRIDYCIDERDVYRMVSSVGSISKSTLKNTDAV